MEVFFVVLGNLRNLSVVLPLGILTGINPWLFGRPFSLYSDL